VRVENDACGMCGAARDLHEQHVRYTLPDPVLAAPERDSTPGTWLSHDTPRESVFMQVPGVGAFVRALLPIALAGGGSLTYGVWTGVDPAELRDIMAVWFEPEYRDLRVQGWLANTVQPWGLLSAPVELAVRELDYTPYCDSSTDPALDRVLHDEWDHDLVLRAAGVLT
jgi:hypothetical protein